MCGIISGTSIPLTNMSAFMSLSPTVLTIHDCFRCPEFGGFRVKLEVSFCLAFFGFL